MTESTQPRRRQTRRREIESILATRAPRPRPRSFPRLVVDADEQSSIARLRHALEGLGPVFVACGRYLASRRDVFSGEFCRDLALLADKASPMPSVEVRAQLRSELGVEFERLFGHFESEPDESRLFFQTHRARLTTGEAVTVKLARGDIERYLAEDLELLALLAPWLAPWGRREIDEVLASALSCLEDDFDLRREAEALETLASTALGELRVPRVVRRLSTSRVLTTERVNVLPLTGTIADADQLAHRLSLVWLYQVLLGCRFPLDPSVGNVAVTPDQRIVFQGGGFARSSPSRQERLWLYLAASAAHDPDRVCTAMTAMTAMTSGDDEALRRRLRQIQPLRESTSPGGDRLTDYLLLHWRLAAEMGYRPDSALVDFYRGLAVLGSTVRQLGGERDALLTAFEEVRLDAELGRWRQSMDVGKWSQDLASCAAFLGQLPQKLDTALSAAAEGGIRVHLQISEPPAARQLSVPLTALAFLAVAFLIEHLAALPGIGVWSEKLGALVLLVAGGFLLKNLGAGIK